MRYIFERFLLFGSAKLVAIDINRQGFRTKIWTTVKGNVREGKPWNTAQVYRVLNNVLYIGKVSHKGTLYNGEQPAIITEYVWNRAHAILESNSPHEKNSVAKTKSMALLRGIVRCGHCDCAMGPSYTTKNGRQYQYYICEKDTKRPVSMCPLKTLPTGDIDRAVLAQVAKLFSTPSLLQQVWKTGQSENAALSRASISEALSDMAFIWDDLFPVERNRLLRLLVKEVTVEETGLRIEIQSDGLECAIKELQAGK